MLKMKPFITGLRRVGRLTHCCPDMRLRSVLAVVVAILFAYGAGGSAARAEHLLNGQPASGDIPGASGFVSLQPTEPTAGSPVTWWCDDRLESGSSTPDDGVVSCHMRDETFSTPYDEGLATDLGAIPGGNFKQPGGSLKSNTKILATTYVSMIVAQDTDGVNHTILSATVAGNRSTRPNGRITITPGIYDTLVISDGCTSGCVQASGGPFLGQLYDALDLAIDEAALADTTFATPHIGWKSTIDIENAGAAGAFLIETPADHTSVLNPDFYSVLTNVVFVGAHNMPFIHTPLFCCGMGGAGYSG